jgi:hypothetical protein
MSSFPLSASQTLRCVVLGIILWAVAVVIIRLLAPMGALEGAARVWTYLLVIPGTFPFLLVSKRVAGLPADRTAVGIAVMTAAAVLLDGIALAWLPWLYGDTVEVIAAAGAVILWGGGVGLVLGFLMNR